MFANDHDTIFAPSSGAGRAAIAVVRISGPGCSETLKTMAPGAEFPDRRAVLRTLRHPESREPLDRALITRFQAPRSFTGEEMAEVSVTGGRAVAAAVVKALATIPGLRLAEPGEFAWRAFVNGKIDLAEVEGLADLVEAETELVAGFHTEYSGLRFGLFFIAEYVNMLTVSCIATLLFFGGWNAPLHLTFIPGVAWFVIKVACFMFFYMWLRATLPRLRYDRLMAFGWKVLLPLATLNLVVTAIVVAYTG